MFTLFNATVTNLGTPTYISGIPYFGTGGTIALHDINAYNWIGQTYLGTATPLTITSGTITQGSGTIVAAQGVSYTQLDGSPTFLIGGIPKAETGRDSMVAYTLGAIPVSINGTGVASGKIKIQLANVNGSSTLTELPTQINIADTAPTGFNELIIPVSVNLGGSYSDNGKRIYISGAAGATPTVNSSFNYYVSSPFVGNIPVGATDEAVVRFGTLGHDTTNYSLMLPPGPDLSGRGGLQYFRFAFRRTQVANFTLTYTGKISGLMMAAPGTTVDQTSTLNKWVDATLVYAGAGVPGANTGAGGNGSNGCAKSAGDVIVLGHVATNEAHILTLGNENVSNAYGNEVLISIALDVGDYITSISIS